VVLNEVGKLDGKILKLGCEVVAIVKTASRIKADLIIMGTHGRHGLRRALLTAAALVSANGAVIDRLPDWHPGTLVVDL
jgi:hypothetical protein